MRIFLVAALVIGFVGATQAQTPTVSSPPASLLTPEQARQTLIFLGRVELKGMEAPVFMEIVGVIQKMSIQNSDSGTGSRK